MPQGVTKVKQTVLLTSGFYVPKKDHYKPFPKTFDEHQELINRNIVTKLDSNTYEYFKSNEVYYSPVDTEIITNYIKNKTIDHRLKILDQFIDNLKDAFGKLISYRDFVFAQVQNPHISDIYFDALVDIGFNAAPNLYLKYEALDTIGFVTNTQISQKSINYRKDKLNNVMLGCLYTNVLANLFSTNKGQPLATLYRLIFSNNVQT